ncbi:hypothetical protein [Streptomyces sp. NPDC020747]|uniref:hypothetical protein n=1 Tax=Streptomyces sp. NPDC020747 TaxID=3365086 RepID=UPI00379250CD
MLRHHLVRVEPRQQLPGPGEFGVRGIAEQPPNAGILTNEPPLTMQSGPLSTRRSEPDAPVMALLGLGAPYRGAGR